MFDGCNVIQTLSPFTLSAGTSALFFQQDHVGFRERPPRCGRQSLIYQGRPSDFNRLQQISLYKSLLRIQRIFNCSHVVVWHQMRENITLEKLLCSLFWVHVSACLCFTFITLFYTRDLQTSQSADEEDVRVNQPAVEFQENIIFKPSESMFPLIHPGKINLFCFFQQTVKSFSRLL